MQILTYAAVNNMFKTYYFVSNQTTNFGTVYGDTILNHDSPYNGIYNIKGDPINILQYFEDVGEILSSKKKKNKVKKPFIKSHTDIPKVKVGKLFARKTKNNRLNQPTQKGARVRYSPVSYQ